MLSVDVGMKKFYKTKYVQYFIRNVDGIADVVMEFGNTKPISNTLSILYGLHLLK